MLSVGGTVRARWRARCCLAALTALLLLPAAAVAQPGPIVVDGSFEDWQDLEPLYVDRPGDGGAGRCDLGRLWVADDGSYLYMRVEVGREISLQDRNEVVLLLDGDNDVATGRRTHGIGAELVWDFGYKPGKFYSRSDTADIVHSDVGIVTAPTVTASQFEVAIRLAARPDGSRRLFHGDSVGICLYVKDGGDVLPDRGGKAIYELGCRSVPAAVQGTTGRSGPNHLRVLSYNILKDGLFDPKRSGAFQRILHAIGADIIGFEEFDKPLDQATIAGLRSLLPGGPEDSWHTAQVSDNVVVSRYPIVGQREVSGNGAFLIDLQGRSGRPLLLIVAHPPCCNRDEARQAEIDAMMAFVRDVRKGDAAMAVSSGTPIVIIGDMNLVGFAEQLRTLLEGDIVNRTQFGPSFAPDWDGTPLADAVPRHVASPFAYTWYSARSSFTPGRLDYIVYTDSVLRAGNRFVLFTPEMPTDLLASLGLRRDDTVDASDHLPVVCDFELLKGE